jgi:drug/metabolite transporter (DMT)-like permease
MKSEKALIVFGFVLISIIWGSTWLAIKIGLESVSPFYGVAIRFSVAAVILFVLLRLRGEKLLFDRSSITLYITLALLSFSFPFALVYWGEQYIPSGLASILFAAYPFVVALGSHFFLPNEPLNPYKVSGIALGFIGVLIIFWSDIHLGSSGTLGMIAVLVSTLLQGTSLVIVKRQNHQMSAIAMSLGGMIFGVLILYALAFFFEDFSTVHFDGKGIGSILYLGTFGTVVTFVVYYWLLKRIEAVYLSLVSLVTPVLAVFLGTFWLGEKLESRVFSGAALVLLGILIANGKDLLQSVHQHRKKIFGQGQSSGNV